jgi:hypothetical protein
VGDYRIVIEGVGSHGCGRDYGPAEERPVTRCGATYCSDCAAIAAVELVKKTGSVAVARLEHWPIPGAAGTTRFDRPGPIDNLLAGTRTGSWDCDKNPVPGGVEPPPPANATKMPADDPTGLERA